jgi:hypothetical protein
VGVGVSIYDYSWSCPSSTFVAPAGSVVTFTLTYAGAQACCLNVFDGPSASGGGAISSFAYIGESMTSFSNHLTVSIPNSYSGLGFIASVAFSPANNYYMAACASSSAACSATTPVALAPGAAAAARGLWTQT